MNHIHNIAYVFITCHCVTVTRIDVFVWKTAQHVELVSMCVCVSTAPILLCVEPQSTLVYVPIRLVIHCVCLAYINAYADFTIWSCVELQSTIVYAIICVIMRYAGLVCTHVYANMAIRERVDLPNCIVASANTLILHHVEPPSMIVYAHMVMQHDV